jgi:hypothetical protein
MFEDATARGVLCAVALAHCEAEDFERLLAVWTDLRVQAAASVALDSEVQCLV